jgi:hypothetical protein
MNSRNEDSRCKGVTKRGEPCRAAATAGGLCFFHANPSKASELGRIGGRKNRHVVADMIDPLPVVVNEFSVRDIVARLVADVSAGKVHPKMAASLAQLLNLQLRTFGALDAAQRIFVQRPYTWRRSGLKPETSKVKKEESSNVAEPEISNVRRPENPTSARPEVSSLGKSESPSARKSEIPNVKKPEASNGGWPEMAKLGEPEISNEEDAEISRAEKSTISKTGKAESSNAASPELSSAVPPVLSTNQISAIDREYERQLAIETALAHGLSHAFGLDEL